MHRILLRLATAVQLTRTTIAFGAISDVWLVILLTRAHETFAGDAMTTMPLWLALLAGAVVAVGLFGYGAALNDVLDVRHDATFSPQRPIPAGRIRLGQAVVVMVGSLIVAVLGGAAFGIWGVCVTMMTAAGVLFYNAAGKFIPAIGLMTIGLIHGTHMLIPNISLPFLLPVWLVMTHTLVIAAAVYVLEDKRPRMTSRSLVLTVVAWAFWSAVIGGVMLTVSGTLWPASTTPWRAAYPALAAALFVVVAILKTRRVSPYVAAEKLKRYAAMWQSLYCAMWLLSVDLLIEAAWMAGFAVSGFLLMTAIKEMSGQADRPLSYR